MRPCGVRLSLRALPPGDVSALVELRARPPGPPILVSPGRERVHRATEAAAVFLVAPWLAWLALRRRATLSPADRLGLGALAAGTLLVDLPLLLTWRRSS